MSWTPCRNRACRQLDNAPVLAYAFQRVAYKGNQDLMVRWAFSDVFACDLFSDVFACAFSCALLQCAYVLVTVYR